MRRNILCGTLFVIGSMMAFGQTPSTDSGQNAQQQELRQKIDQTRQDKQQVNEATRQTEQTRADLKTDIKDGNKAAANQEKQNLQQQKDQLSKETAKTQASEAAERNEMQRMKANQGGGARRASATRAGGRR